jgi:hypothetical protein
MNGEDKMASVLPSCFVDKRLYGRGKILFLWVSV